MLLIPLQAKHLASIFHGRRYTRDEAKKFLSTIPLGRFAQPRDIANAACYLSSDEASMVTGVCMQVDGGRCI